MRLNFLHFIDNIKTTSNYYILGNYLDSSEFDIPLMICLLRNLAELPISDLLPHKSRTDKTDELARIKFHRNSIAHGHRISLSDERFVKIWKTVCKVS